MPSSDASFGRENKQGLLVTRSGRTYFAFPQANVREVFDPEPILPLPLLPAGLKGVIKFRDSVIPVLNPEALFGVEAAGETGVMLILEVDNSLFATTMGEVVEIVKDDVSLEPAPFLEGQQSGLVQGLIRQGTNLALVVDLAAVKAACPFLTEREQTEAAATTEQQTAAGQLCLFRISGVLFALPVNTIGRILKKTEIMPVENAGEFIRGKIVDPDVAIGSGGPKPQDYLPVVDMYRLCGLAEVEDKTHALVIVDDGGSRVGLFTGPVQQISETAGAGKQEISTVVRTPGNSFLSTTLILPDGVLVHLLDSQKLLRQIGLKVAM